MEQTYDIFEALPDGTLEWRECLDGHEAALARARELASLSTNEFRVMHLATNAIVLVLNAKQPRAGPGGESPNSEEGRAGQTDLPVPWWSLVRRPTKSVL